MPGCGILIVDDDPDIRLLMRVVIRTANEGLEISGEAASGVEALENIDRLDPEVVVLDQMMPEMTGLEVAKAIRAKRPQQAMIMCSAYLTSDVKAEAKEIGFGACISKEEIDRLPEVARAVGGCA